MISADRRRASRRLADYATYLRPPWLRRYTYRLKYAHRSSADWPGYLAGPYREAVLPGEDHCVAPIVPAEPGSG